MSPNLAKISIPLVTSILLLVYTFSLLIKTDSSFDQDLGRHLKLGGIILTTGQVPSTNLFSYTAPDFPFVNHHWLFEVLAYLGEKGIGVEGLLILKVLIFLLAILITIKSTRTNSLLTLPVAFIFFHLLRERTDLRPEIFSFLFTALTLYTLEKFTLQPRGLQAKLLWTLPLIQLIWINTHIYFLVGLILQGIYLLQALYSRKLPEAKLLGLCLLGSLLISLANPNFINGLVYPLTVFGNYGYSIVENQTIFTLESINFQNPNFIYYKLAAGIILLALAAAAARKALSLKTILLSLAGLALATIHVRSFPYIVFISLPALSQLFPKTKNHFLLVLIYLISGGALVYESFNYLNNSYYLSSNSTSQAKLEAPQHSKGAMEFVLKNKLPQPIYNNFDIGSYIIYRGFPEYRVFVDGRPEAYPKEFFQDVYIPSQSDPKVFQELSEKLNLKTIIFSHTDQTPWAQTFLDNIVKNPQWQVVYLDETMIILIKEQLPAELKTIKLKDVKPADFRFTNYIDYLRLAIFFNKIGLNESANSFYQQSLRLKSSL